MSTFEKVLCASKFKIFSHFCVATRKTLNTKVVRLLKIYNFGFGQKFIWSIFSKLFSKHICLKFERLFKTSNSMVHLTSHFMRKFHIHINTHAYTCIFKVSYLMMHDLVLITLNWLFKHLGRHSLPPLKRISPRDSERKLSREEE